MEAQHAGWWWFREGMFMFLTFLRRDVYVSLFHKNRENKLEEKMNMKKEFEH